MGKEQKMEVISEDLCAFGGQNRGTKESAIVRILLAKKARVHRSPELCQTCQREDLVFALKLIEKERTMIVRRDSLSER